jgi:hypothetical protein
MNPILEQIISQLKYLSNDELLHLSDEISDILEEGSDSLPQPLLDVDLPQSETTASKRRNPPRIGKLIEWGVVNIGDRLYVNNHPDSPATLISSKKVEYQGEKMSVNVWGAKIAGWPSISIYASVFLEREKRLLGDIRREAMIERGMDVPDRGE